VLTAPSEPISLKLRLRTAAFYRSDLFGYEIKLKRGGR
jgi:hypothetical protein